MQNSIYYVYEKATGKFMGSGTPFFDDEIYGCTEIPCPEYPESESATWDGEKWVIAPI